MKRPAVNEMIQDPAAPFQALRAAIKSEMHCALPGIVEAFDPVTQTATIQPAIRSRIAKDTGVEHVQLPLLANVPVFFPGGGQYALTMPVQQGDECLVVFADSCIDAWWQSGGVQNQIDMRSHDISDGFAFVGFRSRAKALSGVPDDAPAVIGNPDALRGPAGKDAYQIWLDNGHTGTETDFLISLIGSDGAPGLNGKSVTNANFVGNDLVFTLSDTSTVTIPNGKVILTGPAGANGSDATVTKVAVEAVLTGDISSHNHDTRHVKKDGDTMSGALILPNVRPYATYDPAVALPQDLPEGISYKMVSTFTGTDGYGAFLSIKDGNFRAAQFMMNSYGNGLYWRGGRETEGWSPLRKIYHDGSKPTPADIGAATASHAHSVADVTSGTFTVARGGTGLATVPANEYLKGNGTSALVPRSYAEVLADIGAAAASHTHTKANITDFPASMPANGGNADTVGGLYPHTQDVNNQADKLVRTNGSGYIMAGWINTVSGSASGTPTRIYCSQDQYIRYYAPDNATLRRSMKAYLTHGTAAASGGSSDDYYVKHS